MNEIQKARFQWRHQIFNIKDLFVCSLFILACNITGYLGTFAQRQSLKTWYPMLNQSLLTPPTFTLPVIWSILYIMIGLASFLAFRNAKKKARPFILFLFVIQLIFNLLWSIIFFSMRAPIMAFVEISVLTLVILVMMRVYKKSSMIAYFMLYPYLIWILFASYLNLVIAIKN